jgi:hypothetical protein
MATELQVKMPWEPRPAEPPLAYARFRLYLELGPSRSLAKAAEAGGLSLARLKQLSGRWQWPLRAVAWDEHQFRERCRHEAQAQAEAQARLLKESADWQRLARAELNAWVRRRADGEYELARPLTAGEAVRLWYLGCLAERRLRGLQAAALPAPDPERDRAGAVERMRRSREELLSLCQRAGASYPHRGALDEALGQVLLAWITWYCRAHPEAGADPFSRLWPWDLPLPEQSPS